MAKNRNLCGLFNLRHKLVTSSWNHKVYHIIKLCHQVVIRKNKQSINIHSLLTSNIKHKQLLSSPHLEQIRNLFSWCYKSNKFFTNSIGDGWSDDLTEVDTNMLTGKGHWNKLMNRRKWTLCRAAFDRLASLPPLRSRPFPLRIANAAICKAI